MHGYRDDILEIVQRRCQLFAVGIEHGNLGLLVRDPELAVRRESESALVSPG